MAWGTGKEMASSGDGGASALFTTSEISVDFTGSVITVSHSELNGRTQTEQHSPFAWPLVPACANGECGSRFGKSKPTVGEVPQRILAKRTHQEKSLSRFNTLISIFMLASGSHLHAVSANRRPPSNPRVHDQQRPICYS